MGWRDFQNSLPVDLMDKIDFILQSPPLNQLNQFNPPGVESKKRVNVNTEIDRQNPETGLEEIELPPFYQRVCGCRAMELEAKGVSSVEARKQAHAETVAFYHAVMNGATIRSKYWNPEKDKG